MYFYFNYSKGWNLESTYSQETLPVGGNITLSVNVVNDNNIPLTYQWYTEWNDNGRELISQATGSSYEACGVNKNNNYICVVTDAYGNKGEYTCEISIDTGLSFTSEGNAVLRIPHGNSVTLSANAVANEGVEISYQWKSYESVYDEDCGDYYETYVDIEGATDSSYTISSVTERKSYCCFVKDTYGNLITKPFEVYIDSGMDVGAEERWLDVSLGEDVTLTVGAVANEGEVLSYEWYEIKRLYNEEEDNYYEDCVTIEGATADSYVCKDIKNNQQIICTIKDAYGYCKDVYFNVEVDKGWGFTDNDVEEKTSLGGTVTFVVPIKNSINSSLCYQWCQVGADGEWVEIPNATGISFEVKDVRGKKKYRCVVTDSYDNTATFYCETGIDTGLNVEREYENVIIMTPYEENAELSVKASANEGVELYYTWEKLDLVYDEEDYWEDYVAIPGATGVTYTVENVTSKAEYRCVVRDSYGNSKAVTFTVAVDTGLTVDGETSVKVEPGANAKLHVDASAMEGIQLQYQWYQCQWDFFEGGGTLVDREPIEGAIRPEFEVSNVLQRQYYECQVKDSFGNVRSLDFIVSVDCGYDTHKEEVIVPYGTDTTLKIENNGKGEPQFKWYVQKENATFHGYFYKAGYDLISKATGATCKTTAITKQKYYCCLITDVYGNDETIFFEVIPEEKTACTHKNTIKQNAKAATCTEKGYTGDVVCADCKGIIQKGSEIKAKGHQYVTSFVPASATKDGEKAEICSVCHVKKSGAILIPKIGKFKLAISTYTYDGKQKKPGVTVLDRNGKAIDKRYYTLSYDKDNKKVGTHTVKITMKGNYTGVRKVTYEVNPKGTTVSKGKAISKGVQLTWRKQETETSGYEIQIAKAKNFKNAKTVKVSSAKTVSKKITGLQKKKTYYVRIRTYKTVKSKKYHSAWSKIKTVKTK